VTRLTGEAPLSAVWGLTVDFRDEGRGVGPLFQEDAVEAFYFSVRRDCPGLLLTRGLRPLRAGPVDCFIFDQCEFFPAVVAVAGGDTSFRSRW